MKYILTIVFLCIATPVLATTPCDPNPYTGGYPSHNCGMNAQLGSKVVGISIRTSCPFDDVVQEIRDEGKVQFSADYTEFLPVVGQENCPASYWGVPSPYYLFDPLPNGIDITVGLAVTLGVHYKIAR